MARKRFNFWLDDKRSEDWRVNELISTLKGQGLFTRAIRDGLRLWFDLRAGNSDVLVELFPQFKEKLTPITAPVAGGGGGQSELAKEIAEQIVLMGGTQGYVMQSALPAPKTPAPALTAAPKAVVTKSTTTITADEIADNMLAALNMFD